MYFKEREEFDKMMRNDPVMKFKKKYANIIQDIEFSSVDTRNGTHNRVEVGAWSDLMFDYDLMEMYGAKYINDFYKEGTKLQLWGDVDTDLPWQLGNDASLKQYLANERKYKSLMHYVRTHWNKMSVDRQERLKQQARDYLAGRLNVPIKPNKEMRRQAEELDARKERNNNKNKENN